MRRLLIATLLIPAASGGDAGILGSVVRGPSALSDHGPDVRMLAQDVIISVDRHGYEITGCFLLHSPSEEGTVFMYFPVDVVTPFSAMLYSSTEPDALIGRVDVTVDGVDADVFPLFVCEWDPKGEPALSWDSVRSMTRPLFPDEPEPGGPFYATRIPTCGEVTGTSDGWNSDVPGIQSSALNAAWSAGFGADDTVLVEYHVTGDMTIDYDSTFSILCYPLQTGSTWEGSIGRGRVTVVSSGHGGAGGITFITGSMLPAAVELTFADFEPLPEIEGHDAYPLTRLSSLAGSRFPGGYEWSFSDFEPSAVPEGWQGLFPGLGNIFASVRDSAIEWRASGSDRSQGWGGSFIYAYLSDAPPERLTVIDLEGVPLMDSPGGDAAVTAVMEAGTSLAVIEMRGSQARVACDRCLLVTGAETGPLSGWIELFRTGWDGLTRPAALPML